MVLPVGPNSRGKKLSKADKPAQWVGVLAFGENCSEFCRATHRLSAAKNV